MAWNAERFGRRDALAWTAALLLHALAAVVLLRLRRRVSMPPERPMPRPALMLRLLAPPRPEPPAPAPEPAPEPPRPTTAPEARKEAGPRHARQALATAHEEAEIVTAPGAAGDAVPAAQSPVEGAPQFNRRAASNTVREFAAGLNKRPGAAAEWKPTRDDMLG